MTLNITVLTPDVIYQCADYRLTDADTGAWITDASRKLVSLQYIDWDGLITYTGVGRWLGRDLSQWIADWVAGVDDATPEWMANRIAERGAQFLDDVHARMGYHHRHTFVLAAFVDGRVRAYLISNFEDGHSRPRRSADRQLQVIPLVLSTNHRCRVIVTGATTSVSRLQRQQLERIAADHPGEGGRIRRALERINADASRTPEAGGLISPECVVVSFRSDGAGFIDLSGGAGSRLQQISNGVDVNKLMADSLKNIGIDVETMQLVGGVYGANNRPPASRTVLACAPRIAAPAGSEVYDLIEITSPDFASLSAHGLNNAGLIVGNGGSPSIPWSWSAGDVRRLADDGSASAVNDQGLVAGAAAGCVALIQDQRARPLGRSDEKFGSFEVISGAASAINLQGVVAATLQGRVVDPGHANTRAAVYTTAGAMVMLDVPGWAQTHSMAINAAGTVLVVVMVGPFDTRSVLWQADAGNWSYVAGNASANVFPIALADDGTVLGQVQQGAAKVAVICRPAGQWELLGPDPGWAPNAMNNLGDVIGHVRIDHLLRPWLRRRTGEVLMLPFFREHDCMATRLNDRGQAIGSAVGDHGSHALTWLPSGTPKDSEHLMTADRDRPG